MSAAWVAIIPVALGAAWALRDTMVASTRLPGSESAVVDDLLRDRFASATSQPLILVARRLPVDPSGARSSIDLLEDLATELRALRGVSSVLSPGSTPDPMLVGIEDGSAVLVVAMDARQMRTDSIVRSLRRASEAFVARHAGDRSAQVNALTMHWTGNAALALDLRRTSAIESRRAELRALPLLLIVLLVAFRSLVAALVPILIGAIAIGVGLGAALAVARLGEPSIMLGSVASLIGLALGVDYSLLTVTRFREALAAGADPMRAGIEAIRGAGHTIVLSGGTVALGFSGLLLVPIPEIRSVGLGGLAVTAAAVALATTLLPVVLVRLGPDIDRGRVGPRVPTEPARLWYRLGRITTTHPVRVLVVSLVPIVLLTLPAFRLRSITPQEEWLPTAMESTKGLADLRAIGRSGIADAFPVLVDLRADSAGGGGDRWGQLAAVSAMLSRDPRVAEVRSVVSLSSRFGVAPEVFLAAAPAAVRSRFVSSDGTLARLDVIPDPRVATTELPAMIRDIRMRAGGEGTAGVRVGGVGAFQEDHDGAVRRVFPRVVVGVILSIFAALSIGFRSLVIPLKATVLNLLSVGVGFGAMALIFQQGIGGSVIGLEQPLSGLFPAVLLLAFCIVFGISMDYEVFLVGRVAEARRANPGGTEAEAIVEGLARTGRVITFAGALMITIFAAFALGDYLPSQVLGAGLAAAVLVDVTLVRLAIGPALLTLAGRWNWWPGVRRRPGPH